MRRLLAVALTAVLAGCESEPAPAPVPTPTASPSPQPLPPPADIPGALPAPELQRATRPTGGWRREGLRALFTDAGGTVLFAIDCDRERRRLFATRSGEPGSRMKLVIDLAAVTLNASHVAGGTRAEINAADPFLRTLAKAKGAIGIQVDDGDVLAIPAEAGMREAVADCIRPY